MDEMDLNARIREAPELAAVGRPLWPTYTAEALGSVASSLVMSSIFFWTQKYLGWDLKLNLLLAAAQGAAYTAGALLAQRLARRFGRRRALAGTYLLLAAIPLLAAWTTHLAVLAIVLLVLPCLGAMNWPMLESLISNGASANAISRRISVYNLVWSFFNAGTIAISGVIIESSRSGIFLCSAGASLLCALLMLLAPTIDPGEIESPAHARPEAELYASRRLAMWLARIALPATYVVVYSLMAMMPSLPVMHALTMAQRTAVSSAWMAARTAAFAVLGLTIWWHTRPRLLLACAVIMLIAFLGVTIPVSDLLPAAPGGVDFASMISWQLILGVAMGIIYSGSLYFGMVLSEGSTEHGGYHEALIGVGSILGPGAGALMQSFAANRPATTQTPWGPIAAVAGVIAVTIAAASLVTVRFQARSNR